MADATPLTERPLLGIGACLAGHAVRYNGETNEANSAVRDLCARFDTRAFCPEVGIGLGVPRPPIHLVGSAQAVRVLDVRTHLNDYTDPLCAYAERVLEQHPALCGYILVKGSPSCGDGRVKRYSQHGELLAADQPGMFAAALARLDPLLPLADDGRLADPGLRERFVRRACAYHEWKHLLRQGVTVSRLRAFHTRYQFALKAHHASTAATLDALPANAERKSLDAAAAAFIRALLAAL